MTVYEMEGFLRGKCLRGDMKVNESNAQYLVRKFSELQSQNADMAVQLANAESKCRELAAENAKLADCANFYRLGFKPVKGAFGIEYRPTEQLLDDCGNTAIEAIKTPATDAFLAKVRAHGVEMFGQYHNFSEKLFIQKEAQKFAARLRKGAAL